MPNVTLYYGEYQLKPVPMFSIKHEYRKSADGTSLGLFVRITLNGTLTPLPDDTSGGLVAVDALQDALVTAFAQDGLRLKLDCDATNILTAYPRILSIDFQESGDNWVFTTKYTIELEFDGDDSLHLEEVGEEWNFEIMEDSNYFLLNLNSVTGTKPSSKYYGLDAPAYIGKLTHTLSAKGKRWYEGTGPTGYYPEEPWEQARDFCMSRLGASSTFIYNSGVMNWNYISGIGVTNHMRQINVDRLGGSCKVTENWVVSNSGTGQIPANGYATEDFTVEVKQSPNDTDITTISIQGSINGLALIDYNSADISEFGDWNEDMYGTVDINDMGDVGLGIYGTGYQVVRNKYDAALTYWSGVFPRLYSRAQLMWQTTTGAASSSRQLHLIPSMLSVGHNPLKGTIAYNIEYNDRPCTYLTSALSETVTVNNTFATDVFAKITVLGRANGPILQDINTVTEAKLGVSIEAVMPASTGCAAGDTGYMPSSSQVDAIFAAWTGVYVNGQVFLSQNTQSWSPKTGRYSRNKEWTYSPC